MQYKIRRCLCHKQPELLEHGVILLQENTTRCHCDGKNLVQSWGWEVLLILPTLQISSHLITWGKRFELEDIISTAVMASLHHMNKDEHRAAINH